MTQKILQINFKFHVPRPDYEDAVAPLADPVAEVPGLLWKVWLMNETDQEAGGIHLFADRKSLEAYLSSNIVAGIVSHPALSDFSVKQFDVMEGLSKVTHGPVGSAVTAQGE